MKKELIKRKKVTLDDLAVMIADGREETSELARMVARGFEEVNKKIDKEIGEVKKEITEVKENLSATRMDVLGIGDRFVSKHEFSQHLIRFSLLEQKVKLKNK